MRRNTMDDFHANIDRSGECWVWTGRIHPTGYGEFTMANRTYRAHRLSWEAFRGPIPDGLHIDHLCRNRACVNPDHLEPVTPVENMIRGLSSYAIRTKCRSGRHDITLPDAIIVGPHGRQCAECYREAARRHQSTEASRARKREWARARRAKGIPA